MEAKHAITLSAQQCDILRKTLEDDRDSVQAHTTTWQRRVYAPMALYTDEFAAVREAIAARFPEYVPTFDILFQVRGNEVPFHCDYESLGVFDVPSPFSSIRGADFVSVHFNLTRDGGALCTLPWPLVSAVHYFTIVHCGIFSAAHRALCLLSRPLFWMFARRHPNDVNVGNAFNNMMLHAVSAGAPRVSYVVRLARRDSVTVSRASVEAGIRRSDACRPFSRLLSHVTRAPRPVEEISWRDLGGA